MNSSGKASGGLVDQLSAGGDQVMGFLRAEYDQVSPDGPDHFPEVYAKTLRMLATDPSWSFGRWRRSPPPRWCCRATATR